MMSQIRKAVLLLVIIGCVSGRTFHRRKVSDDIPTADEFFREIFAKWNETIKTGLPEIDIGPIDPLYIRDVQAYLDWPVNWLDFDLKGTLTGESNNLTFLNYISYESYHFSPDPEYVVKLTTNATNLSFVGTYKLQAYINNTSEKHITGNITLTCDYTTRHLAAYSEVAGDPYPMYLNGMSSDMPIFGNPKMELTGLPDEVRSYIADHYKKTIYEMWRAVDTSYHSVEYDILAYGIDLKERNY